MTRQPRTTMPQRGATQSPTRERICSGTAAGSPWSFLVFSAPLLDQFFLPHTPDAQYRTVVYVWYFDRVEFRSGCAVLFCLRLNRLFSCKQVPESCNHPSASNLIENHLFFFPPSHKAEPALAVLCQRYRRLEFRSIEPELQRSGLQSTSGLVTVSEFNCS